MKRAEKVQRSVFMAVVWVEESGAGLGAWQRPSDTLLVPQLFSLTDPVQKTASQVHCLIAMDP